MLNNESSYDNLPPGMQPVKLETLQYTFFISNPEEGSVCEIIAIPFSDLSVEDLAMFCNTSNLQDLGKIKKFVKEIKEGYTISEKTPDGKKKEIIVPGKEDYGVEDFLEYIEKKSGVGDSLFYIVSTLRDSGFFDTEKYKGFNWEKSISQNKPIIFNFGDVDESYLYQAICGYLLRKLWQLSNKYREAVIKYNNLKESNSEQDILTKEQKQLLKYFHIALLFEEAHQFFPATTSRVLLSFPAHNYFRKISGQLGRKRGFKYNFLITQAVEYLYDTFRNKPDYIFLGSKLGIDDREWLHKDIKLKEDHIAKLLNLRKFCFCIIDPLMYHNRNLNWATKFKCFRSPCASTTCNSPKLFL